MSSTEHWLDRLAVRHTRRQGFKAALAGALMTLPLVRSESAQAAESCVKPCLYTAQIRNSRNEAGCDGQSYANRLAVALAAFVPSPHILTLSPTSLLAQSRCWERASMNHAAAQVDCLIAGCGKFVPDSKILCPGCDELVALGQTCKCCPAPTTGGLSGYVPCTCCAANGEGCGSCS